MEVTFALPTARPAPRPRFRFTRGRGHVYMPTWYRQHIRELATAARMVMQARGLYTYDNCVSIYVTLHLDKDANGDVDNYAKTILDALVSAGLIRDDSARYVSCMCVALRRVAYRSDVPTIVTIVSEED